MLVKWHNGSGQFASLLLLLGASILEYLKPTPAVQFMPFNCIMNRWWCIWPIDLFVSIKLLDKEVPLLRRYGHIRLQLGSRSLLLLLL